MSEDSICSTQNTECVKRAGKCELSIAGKQICQCQEAGNLLGAGTCNGSVSVRDEPPVKTRADHRNWRWSQPGAENCAKIFSLIPLWQILQYFISFWQKSPLLSSLQAWFFCLFFCPEGNYGNPRKKLYYFIYVGLHPIKKEKVMLLLLHHFTAWDFLNRSFTFLMWLGSSCLWISMIQLLCK